jgi:hypothetical protein
LHPRARHFTQPPRLVKLIVTASTSK